MLPRRHCCCRSRHPGQSLLGTRCISWLLLFESLDRVTESVDEEPFPVLCVVVLGWHRSINKGLEQFANRLRYTLLVLGRPNRQCCCESGHRAGNTDVLLFLPVVDRLPSHRVLRFLLS